MPKIDIGPRNDALKASFGRAEDYRTKAGQAQKDADLAQAAADKAAKALPHTAKAEVSYSAASQFYTQAGQVQDKLSAAGCADAVVSDVVTAMLKEGDLLKDSGDHYLLDAATALS